MVMVMDMEKAMKEVMQVVIEQLYMVMKEVDIVVKQVMEMDMQFTGMDMLMGQDMVMMQVSFVSGGYLPENRRGQIESGVMHIADWFVIEFIFVF